MAYNPGSIYIYCNHGNRLYHILIMVPHCNHGNASDKAGSRASKPESYDQRDLHPCPSPGDIAADSAYARCRLLVHNVLRTGNVMLTLG